jgi:divalent metal cation (Fe/Co/Zn/Cd) transporter
MDVFASLSVLGGLFLVKLFIHADALLAPVIGLSILWESLVLSRRATDFLFDASAGEEVERTADLLREALINGMRNLEEVRILYDCRFQVAGHRYFLSAIRSIRYSWRAVIALVSGYGFKPTLRALGSRCSAGSSLESAWQAPA